MEKDDVYFELDGVVSMPAGTTEDDFFDMFIEFIESKKGTYTGTFATFNQDAVLEGADI